MTWSPIDLSSLPAPDAVETLEYETILAGMLADLIKRDSTFTALLESDPAYKILEVAAYREVLVRQRVNEAVKGVMLAFAAGNDLDQIAARYDVQRLLITPADADAVPPVDAVYEDDDSLRRRVQLSFEGFSTAGPEGAYTFHALGAHVDVLDASVKSSTPGVVTVTVLSRSGTGAASAAVLAAVESVLTNDDVRPLTDSVIVQAATIVAYEINATLTTFAGPDSAVVMASAQTAIEGYAKNQHQLGLGVTLSGIYAALHQYGVHQVTLNSPAANIPCNWNEAAYCSSITLAHWGTV